MNKELLENKIDLSYKVELLLNELRDICNNSECGDTCPIFTINGNDNHSPYLSCPCSRINNKEYISKYGEKYRYKQIAIKNRY